MVGRIFRVAGALAVVAVLASPVLAVDFSYGGWHRVRAIAGNNQDRLDAVRAKDDTGKQSRDNWRFLDSVFRSIFVGRQDDDVQGLVQLEFSVFNQILGGGGAYFGTTQIQPSEVKGFGPTEANSVLYWLQFKVPFLPGPWFVRAGQNDFILPRGIVGRFPSLRETGIQVFGKAGPVDLRFEWLKRFENDIGDADDDDVYIVRGTYSSLRNVSITLYEVLQFKNRGETTGANFRDFWTGLSLRGRYGRFHSAFDFIYQTGDWEYNAAGEAATSIDMGKSRLNRDQNVNAWVIWLTGGVTFGPANVAAHFIDVSGDKDQEDSTQNQFYGIGCQTTDSGGAGCDVYSEAPADLWFGAKYNEGVLAGSLNLGGNTGGTGSRYARGNGNRTFALDFALRPIKDVVFNTTLGFIWSQHARPDLTSDGASPFVWDTYVGTEIDLNLAWTPYRGFTLQGGFDYLAAGDYGRLRNRVDEQDQVAGGSNRRVNSNDDSWQAIFMMQWFF